MLIYKDFSFDAAHFLPSVAADHKCRALHGHTYRLRVCLQGTPGASTGWVVDFGELKRQVEQVLMPIDHHCLNEVPGLENPTCELLAVWIWNRLKKDQPLLHRLELQETPTCGVIYEGS